MVNNNRHMSNFMIIMKDLKSMLACTIGFFIIIYACPFLFHKTLRTNSLTAVITDIRISSITKSYSFTATYKIGDKTYINNLKSSNNRGEKNINDTITLYYDPNNINNISVSTDNLRSFGFVLLAIGIIIPIIGIILSYFSNKNKFNTQNLDNNNYTQI